MIDKGVRRQIGSLISFFPCVEFEAQYWYTPYPNRPVNEW